MLKIRQKKIYLFILTLILFIINIININMVSNISNDYYIKTNIIYDIKKDMTAKYVIKEPEVKEVTTFNEILTYAKTNQVTFEGTMTGYGPDCKGCSGIVACSPYPNVKNTIYFNDKEYGRIRILAADSKIPCGTIVKISNLKNYDEFYAIVLDRGGVIKNKLFDLLFSSEKETSFFGRNTSTYTIVRWGW